MRKHRLKNQPVAEHTLNKAALSISCAALFFFACRIREIIKKKLKMSTDTRIYRLWMYNYFTYKYKHYSDDNVAQIIIPEVAYGKEE